MQALQKLEKSITLRNHTIRKLIVANYARKGKKEDDMAKRCAYNNKQTECVEKVNQKVKAEVKGPKAVPIFYTDGPDCTIPTKKSVCERRRIASCTKRQMKRQCECKPRTETCKNLGPDCRIPKKDYPSRERNKPVLPGCAKTGWELHNKYKVHRSKKDE